MVVRGWTVREYKPEGAKEGERVKVYLAVRVEALEYHKFRGSLRVRGTVVEVGGDLEGVKGRRHTFDVLPGREIEIAKPESYPMELVDEVAKLASVALPRILLASIDGDEAAVAHITALGVELLGVLENRRPKEAGSDSEEEALGPFFREVAKAVDQYRVRLRPDRVVLAGPQLYVEMAARYIKGDWRRSRRGASPACTNSSAAAISRPTARSWARRRWARSSGWPRRDPSWWPSASTRLGRPRRRGGCACSPWSTRP
jgi:cell division protein pelota